MKKFLSRKFFAFLLVFICTSIFLLLGKLNQEIYAEITIYITIGYMAGNGISKIIQISKQK